MLGEQTALALALLVAADVLDTVIKPSHAYEMNDVIKMGFLTVLRTGLAYFLAREIKELEIGHSLSHGDLADADVKEESNFRNTTSLLKDGSRKYPLLKKNSSMHSMRSNHSCRSTTSNSRWTESPRAGRRKDSDLTTNSNHSNNYEEEMYGMSSGEGCPDDEEEFVEGADERVREDVLSSDKSTTSDSNYKNNSEDAKQSTRRDRLLQTKPSTSSKERSFPSRKSVNTTGEMRSRARSRPSSQKISSEPPSPEEKSSKGKKGL